MYEAFCDTFHFYSGRKFKAASFQMKKCTDLVLKQEKLKIEQKYQIIFEQNQVIEQIL